MAMNDSGDWDVFQPQTYEISKYLGQNQINRVIENLTKSDIQEAEIQFTFKLEHALKRFMQIYEQQIIEEQMMSYYQDEDPKQVGKFRKIVGIKDLGEYDVRQLRFPSFQFLKVFIKFYETRLNQMETEYHYKLQIHGFFLRVFYPKNQKISSFFKNQIFQMKTKLVLYFCNQLQVIKKVKYSAHYSKLMQQHQIAAMYKISYQGIQAALFYSNVHSHNQIHSFINKNLSEHTTVLDLFDKKIHREVNRSIFKLIYFFLSDTLKNIQKQQDINVEANLEKCIILVHDRHKCHTDAKNQILEEIAQLIYFRMEGKDMRSIFNKIIKNHTIYPYLRVRYSKRSLFCVLSHPILHKSSKNLTSFCQLFKQFFQNLNQENKLTFYLKNLKYPNFINKVLELTANSNLNIENFDILMLDERVPFSKVVLSVKALVGMASVVETRKSFYQVFLKIMLREDFVENIVTNMKMTADSFSNIMGLSKPSTILPNDNYSILSEQQLNEQLRELMQPQKQQANQSQLQTSISQESSAGDLESQTKKVFNDKKQKKSKSIQLIYEYKNPLKYSDLQKFWETTTRESKLQRALIKNHNEVFSKSKFKAYLLGMKQIERVVSVQEIEEGKIFLSTIIERQNKVSHHFIDLQEFRKRQKESKVKHVFVFYKIKNEQTYVPSYVLEFIQ